MTATSPLLQRRALLSVTSAVLAVALAGCDSASDVSSSSASTTHIAISGKLGDVTIDHIPERIVSLGFGVDADALIGIGASPVGMQRVTSSPSGFQPWQEARLHGESRPEVFGTSTEVSLEEIAALHPDLISAVGDYSLTKQYTNLTAIAPVLSYVTGPNTDDWRTTTTRIGNITGRDAQAKKLIDDTDTAIKATHDKVAPRKLTFSYVSAGTGASIYTKPDPKDVLCQLMEEFGFVLSPQVQTIPAGSTPGIAAVSPENISVLDADVILLAGNLTDANRKLLKGRVVNLSQAQSQALAFPSALSIQWSIANTVPSLFA